LVFYCTVERHESGAIEIATGAVMDYLENR